VARVVLPDTSGIPRTRAATDNSWPALTSLTASNVNASVDRVRRFASSVSLISLCSITAFSITATGYDFQSKVTVPSEVASALTFGR